MKNTFVKFTNAVNAVIKEDAVNYDADTIYALAARLLESLIEVTSIANAYDLGGSEQKTVDEAKSLIEYAEKALT